MFLKYYLEFLKKLLRFWNLSYKLKITFEKYDKTNSDR